MFLSCVEYSYNIGDIITAFHILYMALVIKISFFLQFQISLWPHQQRNDSMMKDTFSMDFLLSTKMGVNFHSVLYATKYHQWSA